MHKYKNKYLVITGLLVLILGMFVSFSYRDKIMASGEAEGRIAYVDVLKVYNIHPDKSSAEQTLSDLAKNMEAELKTKAKDLSKDKQQELLKDYQSKLSDKEQSMINDILAKIDQAIKKVAVEKKVRLVLDKKNVIYGGYDMTQDVIDYIQANADNNDNSSSTEKLNNTK